MQHNQFHKGIFGRENDTGSCPVNEKIKPSGAMSITQDLEVVGPYK